MKQSSNLLRVPCGLRILSIVLVTLIAFRATAQKKNNNAYVVNMSTVSVIDNKTNVVTGTIAPAIEGLADLVGAAVTPDGTRIYLTNAGFSAANAIIVLDAATNTITDTITVDSGPIFDAITPDGRKVYVVNSTKVVPASPALLSGPLPQMQDNL